MSEKNLSNSDTTSMNTQVPNFSVGAKVLDEAGDQKETYWDNRDWDVYLGYYKTIPELRQAILGLATWTAGKGYETDDNVKRRLSRIRGWGEDSFVSILTGMIVVKKINGDAYAEIMRGEEGQLINLKPLNPSKVRTVVNPKGLIVGYDVYNSGKWERMETNEIFHIVNNRIANEIHGTSIIESCKWIIDARNEAMADWRRILHRSTIRVLEVDADDTTTYARLKSEYKDAIKNGEVWILPKQDKATGFQDLTAPPVAIFLEWIKYLENSFYQAAGVPKVILGGSSDYTEAGSKVGYLTFEQVYAAEQKELENDLWNQLAIKLTFNRPQSLKDDMQDSEAANTGQIGFQPNESTAQLGRVE